MFRKPKPKTDLGESRATQRGAATASKKRKNVKKKMTTFEVIQDLKRAQGNFEKKMNLEEKKIKTIMKKAYDSTAVQQIGKERIIHTTQ